jgi:hypothetical protein
VLDAFDDCRGVADPEQRDLDDDGVGDACDDDDDGDGVPDGGDDCLRLANPDQLDTDHDGLGDPCDADDDADGLADDSDNCPLGANAGQEDVDGDGVGDVCDPDFDHEGTLDNCPGVANPDQRDSDGDGQGDACDDDIDGDGVSNAAEAARGTDSRKADTDGDGVGDAADSCPTVVGSAPSGCDVTAPTVSFRRTPRRVTHKRFFAGIRSRIGVNEPASLDIVLLGRARSARVARTGDIVLAERHLGLSATTRSVRLKPKRALAARSARFSVRLRVTATDAAGNRRTQSRTIRVRG